MSTAGGTFSWARWLWTVIFGGGVCVGLVILARSLAPASPELAKDTRFMMDTYVSISADGPRAKAMEAVRAALDRMQEIAVKFNESDPRSPLHAFNHKGEPVKDTELLELIKKGLEISRLSQGAFDMTVEPLTELWGFYTHAPHLPSDTDIRRTLTAVGYQHLSLKDGQLTKDSSDVRIGLGGIAKGYALAEAVKVLKARGITSAMVDAGGDVYVIGRRTERPWNIGIQNPRGDGLAGYVSVTDSAVMGAGDYQRFFIQDGRRYHHIFDPRTGYPTEGVASVTLIYPDPVIAQAWGKIPFVLGPQKGLELLSRIQGMDVIIILTSGQKIFSDSLKHPLMSLADRSPDGKKN